MASILEDDFCYYCQRDFKVPSRLQTHLLRSHKFTWAAEAVRHARRLKQQD